MCQEIGVQPHLPIIKDPPLIIKNLRIKNPPSIKKFPQNQNSPQYNKKPTSGQIFRGKKSLNSTVDTNLGILYVYFTMFYEQLLDWPF